MKRFGWLIAIVGIVLLNVAVHFCVVRWDMTDDHRYNCSQDWSNRSRLRCISQATSTLVSAD